MEIISKTLIILGLCILATIFFVAFIHIYFIYPLVYKKQDSQKGIILKRRDNTNIL